MDCLLLKDMAIKTISDDTEELADRGEFLFFAKSICGLLLMFSKHLLLTGTQNSAAIIVMIVMRHQQATASLSIGVDLHVISRAIL